MATMTYDQIWTRVTKSGKCPVCGKRVLRTHTFWQTENPYNRNPDGSPKTRDQIWDDVRAESKAWIPDFTHTTHKETA